MKKKSEYWNEEMETLSPERFREIQEKALLKQLKYVFKKSAFYKKKFGEAGVELGDIRGLDDLSKLPFTEKAELRDSQVQAPPLGTHMAAPMSKVNRGRPSPLCGSKWRRPMDAPSSK